MWLLRNENRVDIARRPGHFHDLFGTLIRPASRPAEDIEPLAQRPRIDIMKRLGWLWPELAQPLLRRGLGRFCLEFLRRSGETLRTLANLSLPRWI